MAKETEFLLDRVKEMIDGESPENLNQIMKLINYHAGYHAGVFDGSDSFETVMKADIEDLM